MLIKEILEEAGKLENKLQLPFDVYRFYGKPKLSGDQISFGDDNDYGTLKEHQQALTELARQFGMIVMQWDEKETPIKVDAKETKLSEFYVHYRPYDTLEALTISFDEHNHWQNHIRDFVELLRNEEEGPGYPIDEQFMLELEILFKKTNQRIKETIFGKDTIL